MRVKLFFLSLFICLLSSCSSTQKYYLEPEFQQNKISSTVLVVPIQRIWFTDNFSHPFGNLSGPGKNAFYSFLEDLMDDRLRSSIQLLDTEKPLDGKLFSPVSLTSGKDSMQVMLPTDDSQFTMPGYQPRMVLLLDQFYYRKKKETAGGSSYAGHESTTRNLLYFETKYTYWDTEADKPIAWGSSAASKIVSADEALSYPDYLEVLSKAVKKIVDQGPLL